MKIHEFQAKQVLAKFGVPVPEGRVASTPEQVKSIAQELNSGVVVVKSQVHMGGRGKAEIWDQGRKVGDGGVKVVKSPDAAEQAAKEILGKTLKSHQNPEGLKVKKLLVEKGIDIAREYYLGMVLDRDSKRIVVMASSEGGMDIEEVAASSPEKIAKAYIHPAVGLADYEIRHLCYAGGLDRTKVKEVGSFLKAMYQAFVASDASIVEINPLVVTQGGELIAADAKMTIDDNALFRQKELAGWKESEEDNAIEEEAARRGLTYVYISSDNAEKMRRKAGIEEAGKSLPRIGVIGNGAGLVMTSLDVVAFEGGEAANFLDIGGGAKAEVVRNALEVVLMEPSIKGVVINIFGGITRCDEVAQGVIEAARSLSIQIPVVVRLEGTRVEEGKKLLDESGLNLVPAGTMREAAEKAVALAGR